MLVDLFFTFAKIGLFTFGGGYAMISLIEHECVEKRHWLSQDDLMNVTVIAESTPGPIAINCATFTGFKQAGYLGAVIATVGMVLPSFLLIYFIAAYVSDYLANKVVIAAFDGIRVAVGLLIIRAGFTMMKKMLSKVPHKNKSLCFVFGAFLFVLLGNIFGVHISTIFIIVISGILGMICFKKGGKKQC